MVAPMAARSNVTQLQEIIETQRQSIEAERQRNAQLENELRWERELFYNSTLDPADKLITWQRTPINIKRGLPYDFEQPKQRVAFGSEAERLHIGADTYSDRFKRLAEVGLFATDPPKREEINGNFVPCTYAAPVPLLASPKEIDAPPKVGKTGVGHGGKRVKRCKCGSANLIEKRQIFCADCGEIYSEATLHPVNEPDDSTRQDDGWVPEETEDSENALAPVILTDKITTNNTPAMVSTEIFPVALKVEEFSLETWLAGRIGQGQTIWSTGNVDGAKAKYLSHIGPYVLDIGAYIAGKRDHMYGSPLRLADGTTNVLTFDIDPKDTQQYARRHEYMAALSGAGAFPISWLRRDGSCHIELYFDRPVNADAARAWCITVCPSLEEIEECYPTNQKNKGRVSWPLWYRIGGQVHPCRAEYLTNGEMIEHPGIKADRRGLEALIAQAVTPADLIPELAPCAEVANDATNARGALLDKPSPVRKACSNSDGIGKAAIVEFNAMHTWDYASGQSVKNNRFCATWRGDDKPSVVINKDGRTATDYGRTASGRSECRDKFDTWLLVNGLDKAEEVKRLIADYRNRVRIATTQKQVAS